MSPFRCTNLSFDHYSNLFKLNISDDPLSLFGAYILGEYKIKLAILGISIEIGISYVYTFMYIHLCIYDR